MEFSLPCGFPVAQQASKDALAKYLGDKWAKKKSEKTERSALNTVSRDLWNFEPLSVARVVANCRHINPQTLAPTNCCAACSATNLFFFFFKVEFC